MILFRHSIIDLIDNGNTWDEIVTVAQALEQAGVTILNSGVGWHEARIPTITTSVPRAAFSNISARLKQVVTIPVIASNRINMPTEANALIASGAVDLISMARPFLADSHWVKKVAENRVDEINTCIACNQACLDHTFQNKRATCLVNPQAAHETELIYRPVKIVKKIAVVGAGPAGLSAALVSAQRGHSVTLFDANDSIGGQFSLAMKIPGKEEFSQTIRYFSTMLQRYNVRVQLGVSIQFEDLMKADFDDVIVATGVVPKHLQIPGIDHQKVASYADVITGRKTAGDSVAIIGAGGIGFDVAEFLLHDGNMHLPVSNEQWCAEWGVDLLVKKRGGLCEAVKPKRQRTIYLLQRKTTKLGAGLGKTTGWVHRTILQRHGVEMHGGVSYEKIDDAGLHINDGKLSKLLAVDTVVVCAGQTSVTALMVAEKKYREQVNQARGDLGAISWNQKFHLIGGAYLAAELDAKRAIRQGAELAASL
jgi:2,4-dienoyl-CoA reductase (NADPH2)